MPRPACVAVDEIIVPFTGHSSPVQYVSRTPNPEGLKAFIIASSHGTELIQAVVRTGLDIANYFDRFFTTARLLELLADEGMGATGTVKRT